MLGEIIADRYLIEKRLGQGGFGTVYLCTDLKLKRQVALKSLDLADGEATNRKRFAQEAECLAGLDHPRIVAVYDSGEWQNRPFLVMQYVQGPTLQDVAARGPVALAVESLVEQPPIQAQLIMLVQKRTISVHAAEDRDVPPLLEQKALDLVGMQELDELDSLRFAC